MLERWPGWSSDGRVLASAEVVNGRRDRARGLPGRDEHEGALVLVAVPLDPHRWACSSPWMSRYLDAEGVVLKTVRMGRNRMGLPIPRLGGDRGRGGGVRPLGTARRRPGRAAIVTGGPARERGRRASVLVGHADREPGRPVAAGRRSAGGGRRRSCARTPAAPGGCWSMRASAGAATGRPTSTPRPRRRPRCARLLDRGRDGRRGHRRRHAGHLRSRRAPGAGGRRGRSPGDAVPGPDGRSSPPWR